MRPIPGDKQTQDTLWTLIATPTIWAVHFLVCYVLAAADCAPNEAIFEGIPRVRLMIGGATLLAVGAIGYVGQRAYREWRFGEGTFPHAADTPQDRERFLEFSSLLLAALSFVAVVFDAMPALLIADCR